MSRSPFILPGATFMVLLGLMTASAQPPPTSASHPTPPANEPPRASRDEPQQWIRRAILAIESRQSVSARIRHRVELFGKSLVGSGTYLEQRSAGEILLRLELKVQLDAETATSLLQVCDGRYLWTYKRDAQDRSSVSRIALLPVAEALDEMGQLPQPGKIGEWLGLGGVPRLLRTLDACFRFTAVEAAQLQQLPVWKLDGDWKPDKLVKLLPDQEKTIREGKEVDLSRLARHLPDGVAVYLGKEDLFPYRIEYRRLKPPAKAAYPLPDDHVILAMELFEVSLNAPVNRSRFVYNPGNLEVIDETKAYLERLRGKKP